MADFLYSAKEENELPTSADFGTLVLMSRAIALFLEVSFKRRSADVVKSLVVVVAAATGAAVVESAFLIASIV